MGEYFCDILCTNCGEVYNRVYDKDNILEKSDHEVGVQQYMNYHCRKNDRFVAIRRVFINQKTHTNLSLDEEEVNTCPSCNSQVMSFGDRYHEEIGFLKAVLKKPCPTCRQQRLVLLEKHSL